MAQGKQTSFGNGEVSPEIHFLTSSKTYANSLSRLKNGFVRYMGGVSNRSGSEIQYWNPYNYKPYYDPETDETVTPDPLVVPQGRIPELGGDENIVGYGYWNSVHEEWDTLEIGYFQENSLGYRVNYGKITYITLEFPEPKNLRFLVLKDKVLITPFATWRTFYTPPGQPPQFLTFKVNMCLDMETREIQQITQTGMTKGVPFLTGNSVKGFGSPPFMPVSYLYTATTINDEEYVLGEQNTTGYDPNTWNPTTGSGGTTNVYLPHTDWTNTVTVTISSSWPLSNIKYVTVYRANGASGINGSMYTGVGRARVESPASGGTSVSLTFTDTGQSSITLSPPIDRSFLTPPWPALPNQYFIGQVNAASYYQQRLIVAFKNNPSPENPEDMFFETKAGDMMASRLGSPFHLAKPLIVSETDAFQFAPPVADGSEVVGFLSMERLIALTERAAYGYMGGQNGVFSPFTLNPVKLSDTGCSRLVEPKTASGRGYYVSPDHTKIMGVLMNVEGQVKTFEASKNANHLLKTGIRKIELISGQEDTLVILRRDGVVITITVNVEGVDDDDDQIGFSTYEVATGYVENIYKTKMKRNFEFNQKNSEQVDLYQDVIVMYVVREGIRGVEVIKPRDDDVPEAFVYSDVSVPFGYRLADNGKEGYKKTFWVPYTKLSLNSANIDFHINIGDENTAGWSPEDQIPLYSVVSIKDVNKLIFYYGEDKYPKKFTYTITPDSEEATGDIDFPYKYSGFVNTDVPEKYRDVRNSEMTIFEKNEYWTRWCPSITLVKTPMLDAIWNSEKAKYSDQRVPVSVYADSQILSSPNNPNKQNIICYVEKDEELNTVMRIPEGFDCGWGNIGLPYEFDMTSMRLETAEDSNTLQSANKLIDKVGMGLSDTQGGFIGLPNTPFEEMQEMEPLLNPNMSDLPTPKSGYFEWSIPTTYTNDGKVSIKHVDPTPITVLALYPAGVASGG